MRLLRRAASFLFIWNRNYNVKQSWCVWVLDEAEGRFFCKNLENTSVVFFTLKLSVIKKKFFGEQKNGLKSTIFVLPKLKI